MKEHAFMAKFEDRFGGGKCVSCVSVGAPKLVMLYPIFRLTSQGTRQFIDHSVAASVNEWRLVARYVPVHSLTLVTTMCAPHYMCEWLEMWERIYPAKKT